MLVEPIQGWPIGEMGSEPCGLENGEWIHTLQAALHKEERRSIHLNPSPEMISR